MSSLNVKSFGQLVFGLSLMLFFACKNDAPTNHDAALPHNNMEKGSDLDAEETAQLTNAEGKSVVSITAASLEKLFGNSESAVTVINYWKYDCEACLALQQNLQSLEQKVGNEKINIIAINLDSQSEKEKVNLAIRTAGMTSEVFQISNKTDLASLKLTPGWEGQFPAFSLIAQDGEKGFYQQGFSENELFAILTPYLSMTTE